MGWFETRMRGLVGRALRTMGLIGLSALVVACGGGSGAIEPFRPTRMMVVGDELSLLRPDGTKYTVNALLAGTTDIDCVTHPLWVQAVATAFGLNFAACNPNSGTVSAEMHAQAGAKSSDAAAQIERVLAAGAFGDKQIMTVYFGLNDILELYAQYPAKSADALKAEIRQRGVVLGQQVNRVALAGPAVLLVTAPDLGLSPFGVAQTAAYPTETTPTRAKFLSELTDAFNAGLRVTIINDGRLIGLVSSDQMVRDIQPPLMSFYGYANLTDTLCPADQPVTTCTTAGLVSGGDPLTWGYATSTLFSPALQTRLGQIAASRAVRNPF